MRWQMGRRSSNVEDRRGEGGGFSTGPGLRLPLGKGLGGGIGTIVIVLFLLYMGVDPSILFQDTSTAPVQQSGQRSSAQAPADDAAADFASAVLGDTEDVWGEIFRQRGGTYQPPVLVLYSGGVNSGCGTASSSVGPFYCPRDQKLYLDLDFFHELSQRFGASGDFADAYVIAHEVGHHVQNLLGISDKVRSYQESHGGAAANDASVRLELQADCFAGIWANQADRSRHVLEQGDLDEALNAAAAVGDDRLRRQAGQSVNPENFTHGSAEQRARWFKTGFSTGKLESCDTFGTQRL